MTQDQIMELVDDYAMAQYDLAFVDEHGDGKRNEARAAVVAAIDALAKDALRYQWLRRGDNDKIILRVAYLPRNENLDAVIDDAIAAQKGEQV